MDRGVKRGRAVAVTGLDRGVKGDVMSPWPCPRCKEGRDVAVTGMVDRGKSVPQEKRPSEVMREQVSERHDTKRKLMQRS